MVNFRGSLVKDYFLAFLCVLLFVAAPATVAAQRKRTPLAQRKPAASPPQAKSDPGQPNTSTPIRWDGETGVDRYRLQMARDEEFSDIVFDRAVKGREYRVTGLAPGKYYWRVAPAADETGVYSKAVAIDVTGGAMAAATNTTAANAPPVITAPRDVGWRTATGEVARPRSARLRPSGYDLVGVNTDGTIYALDGSSGVALWTARFRPEARRGEEKSSDRLNPFTPIIAPARQGETNVVVAFDGGVRALQSGTGREVWRAKLSGRASSGVGTDLDGDGTDEIVVITDSPAALYVLDEDSGRIIAESKLEAAAIGGPAPLRLTDERGVVVAFEGGMLEVRRADGGRVRSVKFDGAITTPPLVCATPRGVLITVGTERGLVALDAKDLRPLGRIATDNDVPRGTLTSADLDLDGAPEIVMVTKRGRVVVINTTDGKIKWYMEGALDAASAVFADVNADGVQDVLVPGGAIFALGFSGRDGSLIWKADEERKSTVATGADANAIRALAVAASSASEEAFIVGADPSRIGLRAVGLPRGAVKTAAN